MKNSIPKCVMIVWPCGPSILTDLGSANGYVLLPEQHPWFGLHYDDIPVSVHGGLTFGDHMWNDKKWWAIGFDTAHFRDTSERWPVEEVWRETQHLWEQAEAAARQAEVLMT